MHRHTNMRIYPDHACTCVQVHKHKHTQNTLNSAAWQTIKGRSRKFVDKVQPSGTTAHGKLRARSFVFCSLQLRSWLSVRLSFTNATRDKVYGRYQSTWMTRGWRAGRLGQRWFADACTADLLMLVLVLPDVLMLMLTLLGASADSLTWWSQPMQFVRAKTLFFCFSWFSNMIPVRLFFADLEFVLIQITASIEQILKIKCWTIKYLIYSECKN